VRAIDDTNQPGLFRPPADLLYRQNGRRGKRNVTQENPLVFSVTRSRNIR
jgi:hypothetical protein